MKNMHVWPCFVSGDMVWFSDSCAGGLYTYNCRNEEICCRIRADVLFKYGVFEVAALVCWKSLVFIFSEKLNGFHVIYDSFSNEIKRINGLEEKYGIVHQAILVGDELYLIPLEIKKHIYVIDLSSCNSVKDNIKVVSKRINEKNIGRTWLPRICGRSLYIPEYEGKRVFCITDSKIKVIDLDIPSVLCTVVVIDEELWAVPLYGEYIFCLTLEGIIKERIKIPFGCTDKGENDIWEIIVKDEILLFLHWKRPEIDIYNRKRKEAIKINGKKFEQPCVGGPGDRQYYLTYVIEGSSIRFFPSRCSMLEVDLESFSYQEKAFDYPIQILSEEWENWCRTVRWYRYSQGAFLEEKEGEELRTFIEYISAKLVSQKHVKEQGDSIGSKIYIGIT